MAHKDLELRREDARAVDRQPPPLPRRPQPQVVRASTQPKVAAAQPARAAAAAALGLAQRRRPSCACMQRGRREDVDGAEEQQAHDGRCAVQVDGRAPRLLVVRAWQALVLRPVPHGVALRAKRPMVPLGALPAAKAGRRRGPVRASFARESQRALVHLGRALRRPPVADEHRQRRDIQIRPVADHASRARLAHALVVHKQLNVAAFDAGVDGWRERRRRRWRCPWRRWRGRRMPRQRRGRRRRRQHVAPPAVGAVGAVGADCGGGPPAAVLAHAVHRAVEPRA